MESIYPRRVPVMGNLTGNGWTVASQESVLSLIVVLGSSVSLVGLIFAFITYSLSNNRGAESPIMADQTFNTTDDKYSINMEDMSWWDMLSTISRVTFEVFIAVLELIIYFSICLSDVEWPDKAPTEPQSSVRPIALAVPKDDATHAAVSTAVTPEGKRTRQVKYRESSDFVALRKQKLGYVDWTADVPPPESNTAHATATPPTVGPAKPSASAAVDARIQTAAGPTNWPAAPSESFRNKNSRNRNRRSAKTRNPNYSTRQFANATAVSGDGWRDYDSDYLSLGFTPGKLENIFTVIY